MSRRSVARAVLFVGWLAVVAFLFFEAWGARGRPFVHQVPRVLVALGVALSAWGVGEGLLRACGQGRRCEAGAASVRLALGFAGLAWCWLALAAAGLLAPSVAWAALGAGAAAGALVLWRGVRPAPWPRGGAAPSALLPAGLALTGLLLVLPMALAPPASTDELVYHLAVPQWMVDAGGLVTLRDFAHATFPFNVEMLYAWALLLGEPVVAKLIHFTMGLALAALVASRAAAAASDGAAAAPGASGGSTGACGGSAGASGGSAGAWAAAALLTTPVVLLNMSWAWVDVAVALSVVAGCHELVRLRESPAPGRAVVAGLLWGMALGTKYTALLYMPLALLACLWPAPGEGARWRPVARHAVLVLAVAGATAAPWYARNAVVHGNPVHPFAATAWAWLGAEEPDGDTDLMLSHRGERKGWRDRVRGLGFYTFWNDRADSTLGIVWLLALPVVALRRPRGELARVFVVGAAAMVVLSLGFAGSVRYQVPALACLAAPVGWWLGGWWDHGGARRVAGGLVAVLVAVPNLALLAWHDRELFDPVRVALGYEREETYLGRMEGGRRAAMRWLNDHAPPDGRVLPLGFHRLHGLERPVVAYGPLETSPLRGWLREARDVDQALRRLEAEGVRFLLVDERELRVELARSWTEDDARRLAALLQRLVAVPLPGAAGVGIREVPRPGTGDAGHPAAADDGAGASGAAAPGR